MNDTRTVDTSMKTGLLWSGVITTGTAWAVTLYWTLVSRGYLDTPWGV